MPLSRIARPTPALLAYPMHGQYKLLSEGYRTRDGHLIEWAGRLTAGRGGVTVVSRPEPKAYFRRATGREPAFGTRSIDTTTWRLPDPRDRRRWWVRSLSAYPKLATAPDVPAIVWNPFCALAPTERSPFGGGRAVTLDLLDDWTTHFAFQGIRDEVEAAYRESFRRASFVTANGAGTEALARRFGRDDVTLVPNGCDAERFSRHSRATGPLTVGYVGKIGRRLDLTEVVTTISRLPELDFVFAGPFLDAGYREALEALPNVRLLLDVHYDSVPALLETFDVGWVPHRVGGGEVGGDVIKTYEYRAAGLPVLATPFEGVSDQGLDQVTVLPAPAHAEHLRRLAARGPRVRRVPSALPAAASWQHKTRAVLNNLGVLTTWPEPGDRTTP
ncbi:glycosyltransferase family protein [Frondihabitans cladoniiphilus]|uniref:Glycosyltransferase involved in cell wall biosynthesis n=1 Tax=Frondihabitans cladoniiphilus TaxID=715785 RepID=A0ABP8W1N1_9MICO